MLVNPLFWKAYVFNVERFCGNTTLSRSKQFAKVYVPIEVTYEGTVKDLSPALWKV